MKTNQNLVSIFTSGVSPQTDGIFLEEKTMSTTTVFTNNRSPAVGLPAEVRPPENVKKVTIRAKGMSCIISPVGSTRNEFFQHGPQVSNDSLPDRATQT